MILFREVIFLLYLYGHVAIALLVEVFLDKLFGAIDDIRGELHLGT
jgi:hypothetical protein